MDERPTPKVLPARRSGLAWAVLLGVMLLGLTLDLWSKSWAFANVAEQPVVLPSIWTPPEMEEPQAATPVQPDAPSTGEVAKHKSEPFNRPTATQMPRDRLEVLPWGLLDFQLMVNDGAVFGLGGGHRGLLIAFTLIAVAIALWIFGWRTAARSRMVHVGIALVLAGALGNLWDRIAYGIVRDFLYMLPEWNLPFGLTWPGGDAEVWPWIFNVADVLLLAGLGLIFIHMYRADRASKVENQEPKVESRRSSVDPPLADESRRCQAPPPR